jgi:TolB-like protein/Tfp pilus assembly protein PilF
MKRCPTCLRTYADETLNFCLEDGEWLSGEGFEKENTTQILPAGAPPGVSPGEAQTSFLPPTDKYPHTASNRNSLIAGAVGILLITILGAASYLYYGRRDDEPIRSIAVMPFVNASGNPDMEYLSDGLTETLIAALSRVPDLSVKARNAVFRYKGLSTQPSVLGDELGVEALLTGRVVPRGSDISVFVELIDPGTEKVLWSENYDRSFTNLITLQKEIAEDVSKKLQAKLSNADGRLIEKTFTQNPEAYQQYLLGRFYWNKRNPEGIKKAIEHFNQAIVIDPNYALAYAGLADAYTVYLEDAQPTSAATLPQARLAATKALELDNELAAAHGSLGLIMLASYEWVESEREFTRAITLDPNYGSARHWHANLLSALGRHGEALEENRRALAIDPASLVFTVAYGLNLFHARRFDEALAQANKAIEMDAKYSPAYSLRGSVHALRGNYAEAVDAFCLAREYQGDIDASVPRMRKSFAEGGWRGFLLWGTENPRTRNFPYTMARLYLQLGEVDKAIAQLNRSFEIREQNLTRVKVDPRLDGIRRDPRYLELLNKLNLAP